MFLPICLFVSFASTQAQAPANWPSDADLDKFLAKERQTVDVPGMSVALVKNGTLVYAKGFGIADVENEVPVKPETVFRLGSITKQFTASMIMQLVQEGKLSLDAKLKDLLPTQPKAWSSVTVRQLLSHTSGIPNYTDTPDFLDMIRRKVTTAHILDNIAKKPLDFQSGSKWNYSNSGYILLGMILEKIEGKTYREILKKRILDPLDMHETYFANESEIIKNRACGYTQDGKSLANSQYIDMSWPFAAGSIESTVRDLAKWDAGLYGEKVLKQASLAKMWTPTKLTTGKTQDYGFGWGTELVNGIQIVSHGGGINGFLSFIERAPSIGTTVIVLVNSDRTDPEQIAAHLAGFVDPRLVKKDAPIADNDNAATAKIRKFLDGLFAGSIDASLLSPAMQKILTPDMVKQMSSKSSALGALQSMTLIKSELKDGNLIRSYVVKFEKMELRGDFQIDKTGHIADGSLHMH